MSTDLLRLLALREVDEALRGVEGKMKDLDEEEVQLRGKLRSEEDGFRGRQEEHQRLRHAAARKAMEADEVDERIRTYQNKLDREIIPYKEMEHLEEQVIHLRGQLDALSEEALRLMEEVEADEERLREETRAHQARVELLEGQIRSQRERLAELKLARAELLSRREEVAKMVPAHLLQHYERLRESVPDPMVPVCGGVCSGCHLGLAETTLERVRAREVVVCENCSRFLYWP